MKVILKEHGIPFMILTVFIAFVTLIRQMNKMADDTVPDFDEMVWQTMKYLKLACNDRIDGPWLGSALLQTWFFKVLLSDQIPTRTSKV